MASKHWSSLASYFAPDSGTFRWKIQMPVKAARINMLCASVEWLGVAEIVDPLLKPGFARDLVADKLMVPVD